MRHARFLSALLLSLLTLAAAAPASDDATVELGRPFKARQWLDSLGRIPSALVQYDSLPVAEAIPRQTEFYTIDPTVVAAAYSYFFHVEGAETEFIVGSTANLAKLVHELAVAEEIRKRNKGKEFARGVTGSLKGIGSGLVNLAAHPGISLKSAGQRLRQTGRSIESLVDGDSIGPDESGADRSLLGDGPAGAARRRLAYELRVDVYTSNPVLREELTSLSHAYAAGSFATMAIPYSLGMLSHFNPLAGDDQAERFIRDNSPYETRRTAGMALEPIFSMSRGDPGQALHAFLNNPNFSPRMAAYAGLDLQALQEAENLILVLNALAGASTPEEADMRTLTLRLYGLLHRNVQPVAAFRAVGESFAAIGRDGAMYVLLPCDTLRPWEATTEIFGELLREAEALGVRGLRIWSLGDVHPGMIENARRYGVEVRENVLRDPAFFPGGPQ